MSGVLITGTDTGVGKTEVCVRLARSLVAEGLRVGVMKPCETGLELDDEAPGVLAAAGAPEAPVALPAGSDAARLLQASGSTSAPSDVRPFAYRLPAAPSVAARAEGQRIDLARLDEAYARLEAAHDLVLVEGAGGIAVPLIEGFDFADLAARWRLPVLLVARTGLGTLNHTALSVAWARARGLELLGVLLNAADGPVGTADRANLGALPGLLRGVPLLAELPHGGEPEPPGWSTLLGSLRGSLGLPTA